MSAIVFGPAEAKPKKIIGGIAGPTGAGKTMSALEIGTGLVADPGRHLFLIDTEFGRGSHYADAYRFQYGQLSPPFTPQRYQEAIEASISAGSQCTIIDSTSHMWEGDRGLLDWHGEIALKMARGDPARAETYNFPAWREPKQALQAFVLYLQRCPIHLVLCFRAKERSKMVKAVGQDGRAKTEIVAAGLQPIIDTSTPYEATFLAMLSPEEPGVPQWTHKALASYLQPIFRDGPKQLSREHGRRLAEWCGTEAESSGVAQQVEHRALNSEVAGSKPAAGATEQRARDRFFQALERVIDIAAAAELDDKLRKSKDKLGEHYTECVNALQDRIHQIRGGSFDEDIAHLEPEEWQKEEGRIDDPRQQELLG